MSGYVEEITDDNFKEKVLEHEGFVLVDFWAPWCGPCRTMAPIIESFAEQYQGKIDFVKLNTDENKDTPSRYGIRGIPTLILFNSGEQVDAMVGAGSKSEVSKLIDKALI